jgi:two-component system sensor histidine kinase TctE
VVALLVPCGGRICTVQVAETTNKRRKLARNIVLSSLVPELLITVATLALVWFGVKRGLLPLEDLSNEIRARSARDLRPIDPAHAPEEARPLVGALNQCLGRSRARAATRRFLANAAHQLGTPLAGLRARKSRSRGACLEARRSWSGCTAPPSGHRARQPPPLRAPSPVASDAQP